MTNFEELAPASRAAHAGEGTAPAADLSQPLLEPLYQSTVYTYDSLDAADRFYTEPGSSYIYYRNGTPNVGALETALAQLEGGEAAVAAASGMGILTAAVLAVAGAGDHLIADRNAYGGTYALLTNDLPKLGITCTLVDTADAGEVAAAMQPTTRAVLLESVSNPTLRVVDIAAVVAVAKASGVLTFVDNTFATPALFRPLALGADLSWHSLAKYLSGHSQAGGGIAVGSAELIAQIRGKIVRLGANLNAFDAWLCKLGLPTLVLRMRQHSANAQQVAAFLESQPSVSRVYYPGLASHPHHHTAMQLFGDAGFGGMLAFELHGGREAVQNFIERTRLIVFAPSLADVRTTLSYPAGTSHRALPPELRQQLGIGDGMIRLSVGIEDARDLIADVAWGMGEA